MPRNKYSDQISTPKGSGPKGTMDQTSQEAPQDYCDQRREPDYSNNTKEKWLTGAVQATEKPGFDHTKKGK